MVYEIRNTDRAAALFGDWQETMIWSCLQEVMGHIYADDAVNPSSVMAILADFCFFAGQPDRELVSFKPEWCTQGFIIMVPQNRCWNEVIENCYGSKAKRVERYAMKKKPDIFDRDKLKDIVGQLSAEYTLRMMDASLFSHCKLESWCADFVSQFSDYDAYRKTGLGVVILKDDIPVAGASSYTVYQDGIEIEIDTKEEYRRKGLAAVCGAKLILECLDRGLYPSWDAQNLWSVSLAKKLGYHFSHTYDAYEICGY